MNANIEVEEQRQGREMKWMVAPGGFIHKSYRSLVTSGISLFHPHAAAAASSPFAAAVSPRVSVTAHDDHHPI